MRGQDDSLRAGNDAPDEVSRVTDRLRFALLDIDERTFEPRKTYTISEISQKLNVGLTPTRDATIILEQTGLINRTKRGLTLRLATQTELEEMMRVREQIEPLAAHKLAEVAKATASFPELNIGEDRGGRIAETLVEVVNKQEEEAGREKRRWTEVLRYCIAFHTLIVKYGGYPRLSMFLRRFLDLMLIRFKLLPNDRIGDFLDIDNDIAEHRRIAEAIKAGRPQDAANETRSHLQKASERLKPVFGSSDVGQKVAQLLSDEMLLPVSAF